MRIDPITDKGSVFLGKRLTHRNSIRAYNVAHGDHGHENDTPLDSEPDRIPNIGGGCEDILTKRRTDKMNFTKTRPNKCRDDPFGAWVRKAGR